MSFIYCKQKTAYEMRISDWSSDVCSSDLGYCENRPFENLTSTQIALIEMPVTFIGCFRTCEMLGVPVSVRKFHGVITMTIKSLTLSLCIAVTALAASPAVAQVAPEAAPEAAPEIGRAHV